MFIKQKMLLSVLIGLAVTGAAMHYLTSIKADIEQKVLRFHVVANGKSKQEEELKLKVRDEVALYLGKKLDKCENLESANGVIKKELQSIADIACEKVQSEGYSHCITARLDNFYFPTKQYENFALPSGNYNALRITIGDGAGENWWCVLYPQLCFISSGKGELTKQGNEKLKNLLTEDEYKIITTSADGGYPVKIKFKLLELLGGKG